MPTLESERYRGFTSCSIRLNDLALLYFCLLLRFRRVKYTVYVAHLRNWDIIKNHQVFVCIYVGALMFFFDPGSFLDLSHMSYLFIYFLRTGEGGQSQ